LGMLVGVISDTHGLLRPEAIAALLALFDVAIKKLEQALDTPPSLRQSAETIP